MGVFVQFAKPVSKAKRKAVVAGAPLSLNGKPSWHDDGWMVVSHDGDSLAWAVRGEFESVDPHNYGELASDVQWGAFAAATEAWLLGMHARAPIACVIRAIDQEYGTITNAWHEWSLPRVKQLELPEHLRETVDDMPARTPKQREKSVKPKPTPKPTKLADEIWKLSYLGEPLAAAMAYHAARGEDHLEAAVFWGGLEFMGRTFPRLVDRETAAKFGRPPPETADRFAHWLLPWIEPRFASIKRVSKPDLINWYLWCTKIQSAELDTLHGRIEAELLRRDHGDITPAIKPGFCPLCGESLEVSYVDTTCVGARCTATNARMSRGVADFLHRTMFAPKPTSKEFGKMIAMSPEWYCARCGTKHASRKGKDGYTVALQCKACTHGYTDGLLTGLVQSMSDRHARAKVRK
jgi:hypothetical protein